MQIPSINFGNNKTQGFLDGGQLFAADRLFSAKVMQEMAKNGRSPLVSRLLNQVGPSIFPAKGKLVRDVFDALFDLLALERHRHEYTYKSAIAHKLLLGVHSLNTASMLTEFRVGGNKADVVILNGTASAYEVKSERDNLDRLHLQIDAYRQVFATVNVITSPNHLDAVTRIVPSDVGLLLLNKKYQISVIRKAINAPERIDPGVVFDSIQLNEAKAILHRLEIEVPKLPNTQLYAALRVIFQKIPSQTVHAQMVRVLKESRSLVPMRNFLLALPKSLQAAAISTSIRRSDYQKIIDAINTPLEEALDWA